MGQSKSQHQYLEGGLKVDLIQHRHLLELLVRFAETFLGLVNLFSHFLYRSAMLFLLIFQCLLHRIEKSLDVVGLSGVGNLFTIFCRFVGPVLCDESIQQTRHKNKKGNGL